MLDPVELSRLRAWTVNTPEFHRLSRAERNRVRVLLAREPDAWPDEIGRFVEAGKRLGRRV